MGVKYFYSVRIDFYSPFHLFFIIRVRVLKAEIIRKDKTKVISEKPLVLRFSVFVKYCLNIFLRIRLWFSAGYLFILLHIYIYIGI